LKPAPARLLIIAGSDSSGGAGIQADIKTATAFGVYAMTAITAITVQNTTGLGAIHPVPASIVHDQIRYVLDDIGADAIKIGMLGSTDIVDAVADALDKRKSTPIVLDPVLASTSGTSLLDTDAISALTSRLFPLATLVTPNIPEAAHLAGMDICNDEQIVQAAAKLRAFGARNVLIKGGHAEGDLIRDVLIGESCKDIFEGTRIGTRAVHGTGCTLSTAIACGLARRESLPEAIKRARAYLRRALEEAPDIGRGSRPLHHMHAIPINETVRD
jgi:hydroxymethylpyrimidine/phosphomethylpyrimidine kinase